MASGISSRSGGVIRAVGMACLLGTLVAQEPARPVLSVVAVGTRQLDLSWTDAAGAFVLESSTALGLTAGWQPTTVAPTRQGDRFDLRLPATDRVQFFRLRLGTPAASSHVVESSPALGETGVAVTRETIFRLSGPLAADTSLDGNHLFAVAAGRRILSRVALSSDRRTATLFYLEPLPADARVEVTFDGTGLFDDFGWPVDLDSDGVVGGAARLVFETLSTTALATTGIQGHVFGSDQNGDGSNRPLEGVTITVDGMEESLRTTTDAAGFFRLMPCPAGRFFVSVDGRTAEGSQWPDGAYYPFVGKAWDAAPGRTNNLAGGSGIIYLPLIQAETLKTVSATAETKITFAPSVLSTNPALAGVQISVPPNALFSDNGSRGGSVGIAPVPFDRLPEPLPAGLRIPLVITIQTDGPSNFDQPVPVQFPNLPDPVTGIKLPPGAKTALWSFNHDTGRWEIQGPATVTADGNFVVSDPGVGARQPGWHGVAPGSGGCGTDCEGDNDDDDDDDDNDCNPFNPFCAGNKCINQAQLLLNSVQDLIQDLGAAYVNDPEAGCVFGILTSASRAARDCMVDLDPCAKTELANPIVDGAIGSALGCIPKVGGFLGSIWTFKSVAINVRSVLDCGKTGPAAVRLLSETQPSAAVSPGYADLVNRINTLIDHQLEVCTVASNLMAQLIGSPFALPVSPSDVALQKSFFNVIKAALAATSPDGPAISPEERSGILAAPRPNNASAADVDLLLGRLSRMSSGGFKAGNPEANAFIAAFDQFAAVIAARESGGWTTPFDGMYRLIAILTSLAEPSPGASVSVNSSSSSPNTFRRSASSSAPGDLAFPKANHFYLIRDLNSGFEIRGRLGKDGRFPPLILGVSTPCVVSYFDPVSGRVGSALFFTAVSGQRTRIPAAALLPDRSLDADGDGLSAIAEAVIGSNPGRVDTDQDGVSDGAEIAAGTDPADGQPLGLGVVATRRAAGNAVEIDAANDFAVLAMETAGLAVFNVVNPLAPVLVSQYTPPSGVFNVVAVGGEFVAAAPGEDLSPRVHLFQIRPDGNLSPVGNVNVGATSSALAVAGLYAYAPGRSGNVPTVAVIRVKDALLVRHVPVPGGAPGVTALAVDGDVLWALSSVRLSSFRMVRDTLEPLGGLALQSLSSAPLEPGPELAVGDGRAYVGDFLGFRVIDASNPAAPALLYAPARTQAAVHDFALTGSGLLLPVTSFSGQSTLALSAYDITNDRSTNFLTTFNTPGTNRAVVLHRGYALAADGQAGLAVVNFIAPDRGTNPPNVSLRPFFSQRADGQEADEDFYVSTLTRDDVQVRDVEFYVNGSLVARSGKFPFAATLHSPSLSSAVKEVRLRARATDTAGNASWSEEVIAPLLPDRTPPRLISFTPARNAVLARGSISALTVAFDSAMDLSSLRSGLRLTSSGPDGVLGSADDLAEPGGAHSLDDQRRLVTLQFSKPLSSGKYRALLAASVTDLGNNPLGTNVSWDFTIPAPKVIATTPADKAVFLAGTVRPLEVRFDERLSRPTVTTDSLMIVNTNTRAAFAGGVSSLSADGRSAILEFPMGLPTGVYRLLVTRAIQDVYGSPVETNLTVVFTVKNTAEWVANASGNWATAANWSGAVVPILNDHVLIERPASLTVTLNSDPALTTLRSTAELFLNQRRLTVSESANLVGPLLWNTRSTLAGGVIDLRGSTRINGNIFPGAAKLNRGTLRNFGKIEVQTGPWALESTNAIVDNQPGATITLTLTNAPNLERDRIEGFQAGEPRQYSRLVNRGLIDGLPNGRRGRFYVMHVENHGVIRFPDAISEMEFGLFENHPEARWEAAQGLIRSMHATLDGTAVLPGGLVFANNGDVSRVLSLRSSHLEFGPNGIRVDAGTLQADAPVTLRKLELLGANSRLRINSPVSVTESANLMIDRGSGNGELRLLGDTIIQTPTVSIGADLFEKLRIENFGVLQISNSIIRCNEESTFNNQSSGVVQLFKQAVFQTTGTPQRNRASGTNFGLMQAQFTAESTLRMVNEGRFEITAGVANFLLVEGSHHGRFDVGAGATLGISGGVLDIGSTVAGLGDLELNNTTVRGRIETPRVILARRASASLFEGNFLLGTLDADQIRIAGSVELTNQLSYTNQLNVRGGLLRLRGPKSLPSRLELSEGAILENAGQLTWTGLSSSFPTNPSFAEGSRLVNLPGATLTINSGGVISGKVVNHGTLIKDGTGALQIPTGVTNSGAIIVRAGVLEIGSPIQTGEVRLDGGMVLIGNLESGVLTGSGSHSGRLTSSAIIRPGAPYGAIHVVNGRFEQTAAGLLEVELGGLQAGTQHDQIVADGNLNLAGTLRLILRDGFMPEIGQQFVIITGSGISGGTRFSTLEGGDIGGGKRLELLYESNRVVARCVAAN